MKDLKTITEKDLRYAAYYHLSEIWYKEEKLNDGYRKLHNEDSEIFQQRTAKLKKQLEEKNGSVEKVAVSNRTAVCRTARTVVREGELINSPYSIEIF